MSLFKFFKKQLATVIQWTPQQPDLLIWRYPAVTDEIKSASKLIVGPGQGCILVYEGQVTDVLDKEGTYHIQSDNIPFITSLLKVMQFFESEHKVALYYYRKAAVVNQGWGTSAPVKYIDPEYKIPVELAAFGNFSYHITNPQLLFAQYVGSQQQYSTASFREVIQSRIPQLLGTYLAGAKFSFTQIDAELNAIAVAMRGQLIAEFEMLGVAITDFRMEGNSFDAATRDRIGRVADVTADVRAATEAGLNYTELEKLRALRDAARNEGGLAGAGAALGAGISMGKLFTESLDAAANAPTNEDPLQRLKALKLLLDEQIINQEQFEKMKQAYLDQL